MIYQISGEVLLKRAGFVVISTKGIGYKIYASADTLESAKEGGNISLWTYLAVRENAMDLYGFVSRDDLDFFEMLIEVPGIGPKSGIGILSVAPVETLKKAINGNDTSYLTKVSGIGKKTAERIIIGLRDKSGLGSSSDNFLEEEVDILEALKALGYKSIEIREALKKIPESVKGTKDRIKEALKFLSGS